MCLDGTHGQLKRWPLSTLPFVAPIPKHGNSWKSHFNGQTALHVACAEGHFHVVSTLIRSGWSCEECDFFGRTPEEVAIWNGFSKIAAFLHQLQWGIPNNTLPKLKFNIEKLAHELSERHLADNLEIKDIEFGSVLMMQNRNGGLPLHPMTVVHAFREMRQALVLAVAEAKLLKEIWEHLKKQEAIEWKILSSRSEMLHIVPIQY